jgi:hypothetical protein
MDGCRVVVGDGEVVHHANNVPWQATTQMRGDPIVEEIGRSDRRLAVIELGICDWECKFETSKSLSFSRIS